MRRAGAVRSARGGGDVLDPAQRGRAPLSGRALLTVAAVALLVRVLYCVFVIRGYVPSTDAAHYNDIALKVSEGRGVASQFPYLWTHPTAFRPPLYPVLLGGLYAVFGVHVGVAQAMNVVLGTGVVVLATVLAARLGGRTAGLVTAGLATVHPMLLAGDGVILTEPLALLLMLATLLALDRERYVVAGLLAGLLVLTRPSAQLFVPVVALFLFVSGIRAARRRRRGAAEGGSSADADAADRPPSSARAASGPAGRTPTARGGLRVAVVFGLVAVATVLPWVIRNQIVLGKPVLVTSNGFNLAAIYSPLALQERHFVDPVFDERFRPIVRFQQLENLEEVDLDATLRKEGLRGIREHPAEVPRVIATNVGYLSDYFWRTNDGPERLDGRNIGFRHATLPFVWLVLLASAAGFWVVRRQRLGLLVIVTAAYMTAVSLITVSPPRLRAPLDVLACVVVGVLIARVLERVRQGRASTSAPAASEPPLATMPSR